MDTLVAQTHAPQEAKESVGDALGGFEKVLDVYKGFVRRNRTKFELVHDAISKFLFWFPYNDDSQYGSMWREIIYGLISANELAMHCCEVDRLENSHGMTIALDEKPDIPATSLRIVLSLLHCVMPALLEVAASGTQESGKRIRVQARMRYRVEQVKCVLRLILFRSYWKQTKSYFQRTKSHSLGGLMMDGGLYQPGVHSVPKSGELQALWRRQSYVGRRTGLRVSSTNNLGSRSAGDWIIGEVLYILRPVFWAAAESSASAATELDQNDDTTSLFRSLVTTFLMDLTSLGLLKNPSDEISQEEWDRRRKRMFLYFFRSPLWSHLTSPLLERVSYMLHLVPLAGGIADTYLWDWVMYWKHPYISEEG